VTPEEVSRLHETTARARFRLDASLAVVEFRGADPFDALAAPWLGWIADRSQWFGVAATVGARLLPAFTRPLLRIPDTLNPKTLALVALARQAVGDAAGARDARARLAALVRRTPVGRAWAYPFPWANRAFYAPLGTPNAIATAFAVLAFLDAAEAGDLEAQAICHDAAAFMLGDLHRVPVPGGALVSYTPVDHRGVYNVAALVGALLVRVAALPGAPAEARPRGEELLATVRAGQRADGLWPYGVGRRDAWVDSFHTGYILLALRLASPAIDSAAAIEGGLAGYCAHGIGADGRAYLFADRPEVGDAHAAAVAVITFLDVPATPDLDHAARVLCWAKRTLYHESTGRYGHRTGRMQGRDYARWVQAWMLLALARMERATR